MSDATPERVLALPLPWERLRARTQAVPAHASAERDESDGGAENVDSVVPDEALLARLRDSDEAALGLLFDRFGRTVEAVAWRILRDRGEAEEIVQDVFLYLYRRAELFDPTRGSARTWIKQVAYSRALDRREYLVRRQFYAGTDLDSVPDRVLGGTDLEREVISRLNRAQLRKAFADLPEKQRNVLEKFYFEGSTLREIAEQLGDTLGNVRHHYYRGIEQLRKSAVVDELRTRKP